MVKTEWLHLAFHTKDGPRVARIRLKEEMTEKGHKQLQGNHLTTIIRLSCVSNAATAVQPAGSLKNRESYDQRTISDTYR